ncbi:hypothetical protein TRVL_08163 [Trypanosoma vivax]|nr:hypothetical protein TRVL_08163 [Trypanosoma vivax]
MSIRVGFSFDLLGTLIAVHRSPGYQYSLDILRFLERKGLRSPPINVTELDKNFRRSMKAEVAKDREVWVAKGFVEDEMPIGGVTADGTHEIWYRIVDGVFDADGAFCNHDESVLSIVREARQRGEWRYFVENTLQRFSTPEPYSWLPEALPTLRALQRWREDQRSLGVMSEPPAVVSNSDVRLMTAVRLMVEREGDSALLGRLFSADVIGAGKPSPKGISTASNACGVTSMERWIHVGDSNEDKLAAERAGCHFLRCSRAMGVCWSDLHSKLQEVCGSTKAIRPS